MRYLSVCPVCGYQHDRDERFETCLICGASLEVTAEPSPPNPITSTKT